PKTRARPAISRGASIRHTPSTARLTRSSAWFTPPSNRRSDTGAKRCTAAAGARWLSPSYPCLRRLLHRADLGRDLPLVAVDDQESLGPLHRLLLRAALHQRVAADELLGLGERAVDHGQLPAGKLHPGRLLKWRQARGVQQHTGLGHLLDQLAHLGHQLLAGAAFGHAGGVDLDQGHVTHGGSFRSGSLTRCRFRALRPFPSTRRSGVAALRHRPRNCFQDLFAAPIPAPIAYAGPVASVVLTHRFTGPWSRPGTAGVALRHVLAASGR